MKIVHISDTHGYCPEVPDGDVLIHSGDALPYGTQKDLIEFNAWMLTLPHKHKIYVPGNHDEICERDRGLAACLFSAGTLLIDKEISIEGVRFWGSPWSNEFFNWSFMLPESGLQAVYAQIPEGIDVLISHGPAYGVLDQCKDTRRVGSKSLRFRINEINPKFVLCGHIHAAHGMRVIGQTTFLNSAICDEEYEMTQKPQIFNV